MLVIGVLIGLVIGGAAGALAFRVWQRTRAAAAARDSREIVADYELDHPGRTDAAARSRQLKKLDTRFKRLNKTGPYWRKARARS